MRLKFVALTSLITAIIAAVLSFLVLRIVDGYTGRVLSANVPHARRTVIALSLIVPVIGSLVAAILVYRRTSRKRKTQAAITAGMVIVLSIVTMYSMDWLFPAVPVVF